MNELITFMIHGEVHWSNLTQSNWSQSDWVASDSLLDYIAVGILLFMAAFFFYKAMVFLKNYLSRPERTAMLMIGSAATTITSLQHSMPDKSTFVGDEHGSHAHEDGSKTVRVIRATGFIPLTHDSQKQTPNTLIRPIDLELKECAQCQRIFHTTLQTCPYDGEQLTATPHRRPGMQAHNDNQHPVEQAQIQPARICTGCLRRFVAEARYCSYDGLPLVEETQEQRQFASTIRICKQCGYEGKAHEEFCPQDDSALFAIEPFAQTTVEPLIPLLKCTKCQHIASPGMAFCPHDNEVLEPIRNLSLNALPLSGFGPRRKMCERCGSKFSVRTNFCVNDGTPLVAMN